MKSLVPRNCDRCEPQAFQSWPEKVSHHSLGMITGADKKVAKKLPGLSKNYDFNHKKLSGEVSKDIARLVNVLDGWC